MNFHVMQPGSSVATSLVPGEAVPKHVTIVSITGREFKSEPIRLRTVRPFIYKDIVLAQDKTAVKIGQKDDHRSELTRYLIEIVQSMIAEAKTQWEEARVDGAPLPTQHSDEGDDADIFPLPLIRLRVDTLKPDGLSKFEVENPQRFSNRFTGSVANTSDVIQFTSRKKQSSSARAKFDAEAEQEIMARAQNVEGIKVKKLVREFLEAQSLTILPQNYFGDAVTQYVDKDDKHAMEIFVNDALANQVKELVKMQNDGDAGDDDDKTFGDQIQEIREGIERDFSEAIRKNKRATRKLKPKPELWDSDSDGPWEDNPGAIIRSDDDDEGEEDDDDGTPASRTTGRGATARGRGRGSTRGAASSRARGAAKAKTTTTSSRSKKKPISDDSDEEEESEPEPVVIDDDDDEESDSQAVFFSDKKGKKGNGSSTTTTSRAKPTTSSTTRRNPPGSSKPMNPPARTTKNPSRATTAAKPTSSSGAGARGKAAKQATLNFTPSQASILGRRTRSQSLSEEIEEDDDEEDAFESAPTRSSGRRR
jgi:double-strand break repair protein MRE11